MPGSARKYLIDEEEVGIYHCYSRCVRRAFLLGEDELTGFVYNHRKDWLLERMKELAGIYAIDILDFGILDNHLHLVLRNRPDLVAQWSDEQVYRSWWMLYPKRTDDDGTPCEPTDAEIQAVREEYRGAEQLRKRLSSISWFHKSLKEPIAKRANAEDDVTGSFWEGRFKSKQLVDEAAVLMCSLYVDLNPIRAGLSESPDDYCYTSVYERIEAWKQHRVKGHQSQRENAPAEQPGADATEPECDDHWLAPLTLGDELENLDQVTSSARLKDRRRASNKGFLPMSLGQYLELLDLVGRQAQGRQGKIPAQLAAVVDRLGIRADMLVEAVQSFASWFGRLIGRPENVNRAQANSPRKSVHGIANCRRVFQ